MGSPGIAICVATRRRPDGLRRLLESLAAIEIPDGGAALLVADNDAAGSAASTVAEARGFADVRYEIEPTAGVAAARNRLVAMARQAGVEYVAFVDDDEYVEARWLSELVATVSNLGADAVIGPVLPEYADDAAAWVMADGYFDRARHRTGATVHRGNTGNCLISMALFDRDQPFPAELATGEDTFFFLRAKEAGAKVVWCDEAIVHEVISADRTRFRWIVRRAFTGGVGYSVCLIALGRSRGRLVLRASICVARVVQGTLMLVPAAFRGRPGLLRASMRIADGVGGLVGLLRRRR